jgi:hypothetical protein
VRAESVGLRVRGSSRERFLTRSSPFFLPSQVGFAHTGTLFFKFYLMSFLCSVTMSSVVQLWLALFPNQIILNVFNGLSNALFFVSVRITEKWSCILLSEASSV